MIKFDWKKYIPSKSLIEQLKLIRTEEMWTLKRKLGCGIIENNCNS